MEDGEELFGLEDDEQYEQVCGEILFTTKRRLAIHCTLCEEKYKDFEAYVNHLMENHMTPAEPLEEKPSMEETQIVAFFQSTNNIQVDTDTTVKIEIECLEEDVLKEEELPIRLLQQFKRKKKVDTNECVAQSLENPNIQDKVMNEEFVIPPVIRNVKKRTFFNPWATPAEERKHKCPICGLAFKEKHNMHYHLKRHSNEKNHECADCGKKFYTPSEVRAHRRFHTSERDYLCSDCGRSYKTNSQLTNHIKRHKNQRDFRCKVCDKAFFDSKTLKGHMYVHSNEKAFTCQVCHTNFSRPIALTNHMKLHDNKKNYKCNVCGAGFNQQAGLFSHMKNHS